MSISFTFEPWLAHVRQHSRYYQRHLGHLPSQGCALQDIPVADVNDYWSDSQDLDTWEVLTDRVQDALVFKTGGTTGQGKLSVYTHQEWQWMLDCFGRSLSTQLKAGDRVANLFFSGDLYASFLFIHGALSRVEAAITEFPFTGSVEPDILADAITAHHINVLAGVPAHLLAFASHLNQQGRTLPQVTTVLFGGEHLFEGQLPSLRSALPKARFTSIGYASVDAGLVGASTPDCNPGEHRVFDEQTRVEIIDELSGDVIEACDRPGNLVVTNFTRTLMPILRYPVGDRACWREPVGTPRRKFALQGRSSHSQRVRVGVLSLSAPQINEIIQGMAGDAQWQLIIEQVAGNDRVVLKWTPGVPLQAYESLSLALEAALTRLYPGIERVGLEVRACHARDLERHPRSGKHLPVIDRRSYGPTGRPQ
ncbi:AMP-binding protein [Pseudomonas sp. 21TX0197]|uniref:phenylacetate--CoA ligase family protein n=1 Tax=Pseudomonas TaxID=286 RepID=UPI000908EE74|nr:MULTISPECIES: AMP-binding protein [Pseudomonas]MDB6445665.1 AMP-binding protein [Pseudomonas sp. 21TX0197]MDT8905657.1 AMP-binding protein [Pseudomonas prosekii]NHN68570.1 phenylacetate--CoA ligase [Pseudomonas fluorescens]ROO34169.1 AMP-dependent synthetase [Pseudomonas sp. 7SR1]ROO40188.1 AMP-dependent synthetase [Pseudomonas sp. AF76]